METSGTAGKGDECRFVYSWIYLWLLQPFSLPQAKKGKKLSNNEQLPDALGGDTRVEEVILL